MAIDTPVVPLGTAADPGVGSDGFPTLSSYQALGSIMATFLASHGYRGRGEFNVRQQEDGSHLVYFLLHPPKPSSGLIVPGGLAVPE